jgi:phage N-6-adenine-methyltransferase
MDMNNSTTPDDEKDLAQTPPELVKWIEDNITGRPFDLDVCCIAATAKAPIYYSLIEQGIDSLKIPWLSLNWCNPPYSDIMPWVDKAISEAEKGNTTVMLIPDKPEVGYIRKAWDHCDTFLRFPYRINFIRPNGKPFTTPDGKKQGPKFPVVAIVFTKLGLTAPSRVVYIDDRVKNKEI